MIKILKALALQNNQLIKDVRNVKMRDNFKGLPSIKCSCKDCKICEEVCPTGAIEKITPAEKSAIQIGHAVWIKENCIVETDGEKCGSCASHCPVGAILMVVKDEFNPVLKIPVVNTERCIGCGQCEYYCPARPLSAIYVEGNEVQREI